jgi:excinuclease ABC subunit B
MQFKLTSKFSPTGDQPQAIRTLVDSINNHQPQQTLLGVTGSGKTFTIANVIDQVQKPTLIISHNKTLAAQLYQEFRDFFPQNAVSYFISYYDYYQPESYLPATDTYIEKETDINDEIDKLRLSTTANLLTRPDVIVVASVSCIYNLGSPVEFGKNIFELIEGQLIDPQTVMLRLIDMQYQRNDYELKRGHFRQSGDTLFVWPADTDFVLEITFLDQIIEQLRPIHPITKEVVTLENPYLNKTPFRYTLYPAKHYQSGRNQQQAYDQIELDLKKRVIELKENGKILEAHRLNQRVMHDIEMMRELGFVNGIENYSRYFDGRNPGDPPFSLLDYFAYNASTFSASHDESSFLTIIDESHITLPQLRGMYAGDRSRKQTLIDYGFRLPSALDNRPLMYQEIRQRLPQVIYASATPDEEELSYSTPHIAEQLIRPTGLIDPEIEIRKTKNQIKDLIGEIAKRKANGQRVLVTTLTKKTAEALTEYLNESPKSKVSSQKSSEINPMTQDITPNTSDLKVAYLHADVHTLDRSDILDDLRKGEYDVLVGINLLREGLDLPEVSLVAILEADKEGFLRSKTSLVQTMGRAARHQEGKVIMYADTTTKSMHAAIKEVNRRRQVQIDYNTKHGITPTSIQKPVRDKLLERQPEEPKSSTTSKTLHRFGWKYLSDVKPDSLTPKDKNTLIKELTRLMKQAAKDWDFELAAHYRDMLKRINT